MSQSKKPRFTPSPFVMLKGREVSAEEILAAFEQARGKAGSVVMLVGMPASGKSTLSAPFEAAGWIRLNKDALRKELYGDEAAKGDLKEVNSLFYKRLEEALAGNLCLLVDNLNHNQHYRRGPIARAREAGYTEITNLVLDVPVEECVRRNASRARKVPEQVIRDVGAEIAGNLPTRSEGRLLVIQPGSTPGRFIVKQARSGRRS